MCGDSPHTLRTHCGKGLRKPKPVKACEGCDESFEARFKRQRFCSRECGQRAGRIPAAGVARPQTRVVDRPARAELLAQLEATSYVAVGRKYGVSDNAVRKWVRFYEREAERAADPDEAA